MAKIMDPILPILSILGYWPLFWVLLEVQAEVILVLCAPTYVNTNLLLPRDLRVV